MANFVDLSSKEYFEPAPRTLRTRLITRKPTLNEGDYKVQGFFSDLNVSDNRNWFYLTVIGELLGIFITCFAGFRGGVVFLVLANSGIIMFILFNFSIKIALSKRDNYRNSFSINS